MLGYINDNRVHGEETVRWHEVDQYLAEGWILADVRTKFENSRGAIPGSALFELDTLREQLDELRGKKVIVTCRVGQRGHTAASILAQEGIEVKNLDGGYLTWQLGRQAAEHQKQEATR